MAEVSLYIHLASQHHEPPLIKIRFSIKALERRKYSVCGFQNFLLDNVTNRKMQIIVNQFNIIERNKKEINKKVDFMVMAQEYLKDLL